MICFGSLWLSSGQVTTMIIAPKSSKEMNCATSAQRKERRKPDLSSLALVSLWPLQLNSTQARSRSRAKLATDSAVNRAGRLFTLALPLNQPKLAWLGCKARLGSSQVASAASGAVARVGKLSSDAQLAQLIPALPHSNSPQRWIQPNPNRSVPLLLLSLNFDSDSHFKSHF